MRRSEKEVTDINKIFDILKKCNTIRVGAFGEESPYIVPLSFGAEIEARKIVVYFHCASEGLKVDLLKAHDSVCVEGDIFYKTELIGHGITTRYESVIGFGRCEFLTEMDDIKHGLRLLCDKYGYTDFALDNCENYDRLLVGKIVLDKVTGKDNLQKKF